MLGCGLVARLRQQVFSKIVVFLAAVSLFLPPLNAPCRCGDHTVAMEYSTRKTAEQTIRPSCCGQRKLAETSGANACCSAGPRPRRRGGHLAKILTDSQQVVVGQDPASVTKHAGSCTCGEQCTCGRNHVPSKPMAAPAASPQRVTKEPLSVTRGHTGDDALPSPSTRFVRGRFSCPASRPVRPVRPVLPPHDLILSEIPGPHRRAVACMVPG